MLLADRAASYRAAFPTFPAPRTDARWLDANQPSVCGDATRLPFRADAFRLVITDPPYSKADARRYDCPMPNRKAVLHDIARVTESGGHLVWLDTVLPMFTKREWHWWGAISIVRSTNHRVRLASFFQRV